MNHYSKRLTIVSVLLLAFGVLAMYSVSIYESFSVTQWSDNYFYFREHLQKIAIGCILATIIRYTPWKFIKKRDILRFLGAFVLLLLLFSPLGENSINEAKKVRLRLHLPGQSIQPGEFFKIAYVFFITNWMIRKKAIFSGLGFFIGSMLIILACIIIFVFLPDFGTILVLGTVGLILYRYAGGKLYYILVACCIGLGGIMLVESKISYIHERIAYYLDPSKDNSTKGVGYQTHNALISVGSGGFRGRGYGKGLQKFGNLPESQSDFIFAAFLEEIGLLGGSILLSLFFLFAYYAIQGLRLCDNEHDKMIGCGLIALIIIQGFVNMGVNTNLLPLTGLTLPFMSHGGSALLANMIEASLLIKIINQKSSLSG